MGIRVEIGMAVCAALAFGTGCRAGAHATSPGATLETLVAAADRGDAAALWGLLPERARRAESFGAFRTRLQGDRAEVQALGAEVQRALAERGPPEVAIPLANGATATTREDPEGWRLASPGFGPSLAATPAEAVRALREALARRSLGVLLGVLSARARGGLEAEFAALLDATGDASGLEVTSQGSHQASVRLPDGRYIILVRENDAWHVDDVRDHP